MERVFVDDEETGRRTLEVDNFSRSDLGLVSLEDMLCSEEDLRRRAAARFDRPRDGGGGASPKIKNWMKAPISRTTESWPTKRPWVKERLKMIY
jgi:hypothetical protein